MKIREKIRQWKLEFIRILYSIKGFCKTKRFKKGKYYISSAIANKRYMYNGGKEFLWCSVQTVPGTFVQITNQGKKEFKYWEIGVLKFKEN